MHEYVCAHEYTCTRLGLEEDDHPITQHAQSIPATPTAQPCTDDLAQTGLLQADTATLTPHSASACRSWPGYEPCDRHYSAAPFPANGTAHASHITVLLGRGCLTNENSEAISVCGKKSLTVGKIWQWGEGRMQEGERLKPGELRKTKVKNPGERDQLTPAIKSQLPAMQLLF